MHQKSHGDTLAEACAALSSLATKNARTTIFLADFISFRLRTAKTLQSCCREGARGPPVDAARESRRRPFIRNRGEGQVRNLGASTAVCSERRACPSSCTAESDERLTASSPRDFRSWHNTSSLVMLASYLLAAEEWRSDAEHLGAQSPSTYWQPLQAEGCWA